MTTHQTNDTPQGTVDDTVETAANRFEDLLTGKPGTQQPQKPDDGEAEDDSPEEDAEAHEADDSSDDAEEEDGDEPADSDDEEEATDEDEASSKVLDPEKDGDVTVNLKIGDKTEAVTLEELSKGYLRQSDYSRKTAAVAETRKQVEAEAAAVRGSRESYAGLLTALETKLEQIEAFDKIDFEALYRTDPMEYVRQIEAKRERDDHLRVARDEKARIERDRAIDSQKQRATRVKETWEQAVASNPAWKNEKTWDKDRALIMNYAVEQGYSKEEINVICSTDHRVLLSMFHAASHARLMSNKPRPVTGAASAPAARASSRSNAPRPTDQHTRAKMRLKESGTVEDAAALFERLLK